MKKYISTFEIVTYHLDDNEAIQSAIKIERKQQKRYDNQCRFIELHRVIGITTKEIDIKDRVYAARLIC